MKNTTVPRAYIVALDPGRYFLTFSHNNFAVTSTKIGIFFRPLLNQILDPPVSGMPLTNYQKCTVIFLVAKHFPLPMPLKSITTAKTLHVMAYSLICQDTFLLHYCTQLAREPFPHLPWADFKKLKTT